MVVVGEDCKLGEVRSQKPGGMMNKEPVKSFQNLMVWQKARPFVLSSYRFSAEFPSGEIYGLTSPFRRAAISISAHIAEGFQRKSPAHKVRILNIAQESREECRLLPDSRPRSRR
jgi:hypothetical protein